MIYMYCMHDVIHRHSVAPSVQGSQNEKDEKAKKAKQPIVIWPEWNEQDIGQEKWVGCTSHHNLHDWCICADTYFYCESRVQMTIILEFPWLFRLKRLQKSLWQLICLLCTLHDKQLLLCDKIQNPIFQVYQKKIHWVS